MKTITTKLQVATLSMASEAVLAPTATGIIQNNGASLEDTIEKKMSLEDTIEKKMSLEDIIARAAAEVTPEKETVSRFVLEDDVVPNQEAEELAKKFVADWETPSMKMLRMLKSVGRQGPLAALLGVDLDLNKEVQVKGTEGRTFPIRGLLRAGVATGDLAY